MNWRKLLDEWKYIILILAVVLIAGGTTILVLQGQLPPVPPDEPQFTEDEVIAFVRYELINMELINPTSDISSEAEYTGEGKWTGTTDSSYYDKASDNFTRRRITWYYYENRMGMGIISIERDQ